MEKSELEAKNVAELQEIAGGLGVEGLKTLRKGQLIDAILQAANGAGPAGSAPAERTEAGVEAGIEANAEGNGGVTTREAERPAREDRRPGGDGQRHPREGGGRQRLSREERRRLREERRQREM